MPDAERGCSAVEDTLITNLGLTWNLSAALMGGHTLGGALTSNSGYRGRWNEADASRLFDNGYYTSLVLKGWSPETSVAGNVGKNQWARADIGVDIQKKGFEMMLDSDMCLYHSFYLHYSDQLDFHASTAHKQGCGCAWARPSLYTDAIMKYTSGEACGTTEIYDPGPQINVMKSGGVEQESDRPEHTQLEKKTGILNLTNDAHIETVKQRIVCCGMSGRSSTERKPPIMLDMRADCGEAGQPKGPAAAAVMLFANDEDAWISAYYEAWRIATSKGREDSLSPLVL